MSRYLIVIERGVHNYSAFVPDLPGCIATGRTRRELLRRMEDAIEMHIEGLREVGLPVPEPTTDAEWVQVEPDTPLAASVRARVPPARTLAT